MNIELAENLRNNYAFFNYYVDVGDGWYHILNSMLTCINNEINHIKTNRAWRIKNNQIEDLPEIPNIEFHQIKEKFGTLRIYCSGTTERISGIISMAEHISSYTCEDCGNIGKARGKNWIRTQCNECFVEERLSE